MSITIVSDKLPHGVTSHVTPAISQLGKFTIGLHTEFKLNDNKASVTNKASLNRLVGGLDSEEENSVQSLDSIERDLVAQF